MGGQTEALAKRVCRYILWAQRSYLEVSAVILHPLTRIYGLRIDLYNMRSSRRLLDANFNLNHRRTLGISKHNQNTTKILAGRYLVTLTTVPFLFAGRLVYMAWPS